MKYFTTKSFILGLAIVLTLVTHELDAANRWSYNNGGVIGWSSTDPASVITPAGAPSVSDDIVITNTGLVATLGTWNMNAGGSITVNGSASLTIGNMSVCSTCTITVSGTMNAGNVVVANGGDLYVAPTGNMSAADFTNQNNSTGVTIDGNLSVSGDLDNGNNSIIDGNGSLDVDGTITNGGTIGGSTGDDVGTLPVELTSFEMGNAASGLKLEWQTATELNNDFFDIERSEDGINFYSIGQVDGNGTTDVVQNYAFTDKAPIANVEYYRLKQVDFDGAFEYSKVIVGYADKLLNRFQLSTYPNPVSDKVTIESIAPIAFIQLKLFNISGQQVADLMSSLQGTGLRIEVPLPPLEKGLYYLNFQLTTGETGSKKLVVE